jgi:hypothetical protein
MSPGVLLLPLNFGKIADNITNIARSSNGRKNSGFVVLLKHEEYKRGLE